MKNLFVNKSVDFHVAKNVVGHCVDVDNGSLFVLTSNFQVLKMDTKNPQAQLEPIEINLDTQAHDNLVRERVKLVEYIVESGSVVIALKSGDIFRIGVSSYSLPSERVYKHQCRICSVKLSPDQDLVAFADEQNDLFVMSADFSSISWQQNALNQNNSLHKPVGVGWGSKETQFFGLDGRPSKEKQTNDQVQLTDEEINKIERIETSAMFQELRKEQELQTIVDWRGDGQLLATLTYLPETQKHYIKVWNRNLELQYMSEQLVTIERGLLSWVPNGKYVCCAQQRDKTINEIAMFEKNGMVHERLTLPTLMKNLYIRELAWSADSSILAIISNCFNLTEGNEVIYKPILMLYTTQNFHYYLKFTCYLEDNCEHSIKWDPICANRLRIISQNGHYSEYDCNFEVSQSENFSTVATVDANKLLISPIEICKVPPPMSAITFETESLIYKIALDNQDASNIFILTSDNRLIFKCPSKTRCKNLQDSPILAKLMIKTAEPLFKNLKDYRSHKLSDSIGAIQEIICLDQTHIIGSRLLGADSEIFQIKLSEHCDTTTLETLSIIKGKRVSSMAVSLIEGNRNLNLILSDSSCHLMNIDSPTPTQLTCVFQPSVAHARLSYISSLMLTNTQDKTFLVSLSQDSTLRINAVTIASNICTSFRATKNYLIYTTTDNQMHFILTSKLENEEALSKVESWSQPIENGGTLISASEDKSQVVLEMPRGNLEVLHPRILIISALAKLLDQTQYIQAIKLARHHRVNMNFICDYLLRDFISANKTSGDNLNSLSTFSKTVAEYDPTLLNIFITELDNEDTISGRYSKIVCHLPSVSRTWKLEVKNLDVVLNHITLPDEERFIQPRILCFLKRQPKDIKAALRIIHNSPKERRDKALKFILYFVDVDNLFVEALKLYDMDVALMVASASNKDPKEYLVLLDKFNQIQDEHRQHLEIDLHVKDYESALSNQLAIALDSGAEKESFSHLAQEKRLHSHALKLLYKSVRSDSYDWLDLAESVWSSYGGYLLEKRHFSEAGLAYSKAHSYKAQPHTLKSSLTCYWLAHADEMSMAALARSELDDSLKKPFRDSLLDRLLDRKKSALYLGLSSNAKLSESEAEKLLDGCEFFILEAFTSKQYRSTLLENLRLRSKNQIRETMLSINQNFTNAKDYFERLKKLLVEYQDRLYNEALTGVYVEDTLSTIADSELSSVLLNLRRPVRTSGAPSIKTRASSNKSNKTAYGVNKKKRITLKAGSRHEDLALVTELKKFVLNQKKDQEQVSKDLAHLFHYDDYNEASEVARDCKLLLAETLAFAKEVTSLLWPSSSELGEQKYSLYRRFSKILDAEEGSYENMEFLLLVKPETSQVPSDVDVFSL